MYKVTDKAKELWYTTNRLKKAWQECIKEKDLHVGEFMTLRSIYKLGQDEKNSLGVKTSDIGESLCMKKPATSKMINNLEDKGYVNRVSDKRDRRITYVNLTEKGIKLFEQHKIKMTNYTNKIIDKMGKEDMETFLILLNKFSDSIEDILDEEKN